MSFWRKLAKSRALFHFMAGTVVIICALLLQNYFTRQNDPNKIKEHFLKVLEKKENILASCIKKLKIADPSISDSGKIETVIRMIDRKINCPLISSAGRLFDAVASIAGLRQTIRFEGQAAMELEFAIGAEKTEEAYPFSVLEQCRNSQNDLTPVIIVDWEPLIRAVLHDVQILIPLARISRKFHNTMVEIIVSVAKRVAQERVVLSGGCFQNKNLVENAVRRLETEGFKPYWHQRIPPNDGGIALGQLVAASRID